MHNYAHCDSYYAEELDCIDILYTGIHSTLFRDAPSVPEKIILDKLK